MYVANPLVYYSYKISRRYLSVSQLNKTIKLHHPIIILNDNPPRSSPTCYLQLYRQQWKKKQSRRIIQKHAPIIRHNHRAHSPSASGLGENFLFTLELIRARTWCALRTQERAQRRLQGSYSLSRGSRAQEPRSSSSPFISAPHPTLSPRVIFQPTLAALSRYNNSLVWISRQVQHALATTSKNWITRAIRCARGEEFFSPSARLLFNDAHSCLRRNTACDNEDTAVRGRWACG